MTYVVALLIFGVLLSICVGGYVQSTRDAERFSKDRKPSSSSSPQRNDKRSEAADP